jgi:hypothetical protein
MLTLLLVATILGEAPPVVDCVYTVRPATAAEKKIYADGFALFQQMVPASPAGWEPRDEPKDGVLKEVCAASGATVNRWRFQRAFNRSEGMQDRNARTADQLNAVGDQAKATQKSNEAKLAENDQQMQAAMKKMQALAAAQKTAEMDAVSKEIERLGNERMKLMGVAGQETTIGAIDTAARKDTDASFSVSVGETDITTGGFKPMTVPVGKGYRQDGDNGGNPWLEIMVLLPAPSAGGGQTVVRISGDPERAEALLKAAKLR